MCMRIEFRIIQIQLIIITRSESIESDQIISITRTIIPIIFGSKFIIIIFWFISLYFYERQKRSGTLPQYRIDDYTHATDTFSDTPLDTLMLLLLINMQQLQHE